MKNNKHIYPEELAPYEHTVLAEDARRAIVLIDVVVRIIHHVVVAVLYVVIRHIVVAHYVTVIHVNVAHYVTATLVNVVIYVTVTHVGVVNLHLKTEAIRF